MQKHEVSIAIDFTFLIVLIKSNKIYHHNILLL